MLSNINTFGIFRAATPAPTQSLVGTERAWSLTINGENATISIFTVVFILLVIFIFRTRHRKIRDLTIFGALMLAIVLLVLVASIVLFLMWMVLGFPSLPAPSELTLDQLGNAIKLGLSVAAAVGVVVTLLVTYRKQRDSESVREADLFRIAVEQLGSDKYFMRLTGVLALRDLADRWEPWRQRCIDMLCVALVQPGEGSDGINRAIYEILRERFNERSPGWHGYSILIAHGEIHDLDLNNLRLCNGVLTLRDIVVSQPVNLSAIQLSGNARLVLDRVRVNSVLNLTELVCQRSSSVEVDEVAIGANGILDMDKVNIANGGIVRMQNLSFAYNGQIRARYSCVKGSLVLNNFDCEAGTSIDLDDLTCNGGRVSITNMDASSCNFRLSGASILNSGYLRIDRYHSHGGWLTLRGGRVTAASVVSLTNMMVYDGAHLDLYGAYNKSGSLFHAEATVNAGVIDFSSFENEDKGSVFVLRAYMEGPSGKVQFHGGGNYRGDVHIEARNARSSIPAGVFSFEHVNLWGGQIDLDLGVDTQIMAKDLDLRDLEIVVRAYRNVIRELYRATQSRSINLRIGSRHDWSNHLKKSPLGQPIRSHDGILE